MFEFYIKKGCIPISSLNVYKVKSPEAALGFWAVGKTHWPGLRNVGLTSKPQVPFWDSYIFQSLMREAEAARGTFTGCLCFCQRQGKWWWNFLLQQQCLLRGWALPALAILNVQISAKHTGKPPSLKERRAGMEISSSLSEVECNPLASF